ncbi:MAG TPA: caspase family protein [Acidobacteriaceae bacterium]|nr:caspase family protein [Acidobacteriaceae bacterium]
MCAQARSLHIGLNAVDPDAYEGWDGSLNACESDAAAMLAIATAQNYSASRRLLTADATAAGVLDGIKRAAEQLQSGDLFLLTYSGHGGRINDAENPGKQVDTWALYDRMLISHELYRAWGEFAAGVRIFVTSDSCHSGTVTRLMPSPATMATHHGKSRAVPPWIVSRAYAAHREMYDELVRQNPRSLQNQIGTSVLLISGCQDDQESSDGDRNGLFTTELLSVWNGGQFSGTYPAFYQDILNAMPDLRTQKPNYFLLGRKPEIWQESKPFVA